MGIPILPPDLNESQTDFSVVKDSIRFGLAAVKNVGVKAVGSMIEERESGGPFKDIMDFCKRVDGAKVNRRALESFIQCGVFDFTGIERSRLYAVLDDVIRLCGANQDPNQMNMFASLNDDQIDNYVLLALPEKDEWDESEKLRREKEALGFYITGHPLDRFKEEVERFATCSIQELFGLKDKSKVRMAGVVEKLKIKRTKRGNKMAILTLEDPTGSTEVVLFPDVFEKYSPLLKGDEPLLITGTAEKGDNGAKILAQEVTSLEREGQNAIRSIELGLYEQVVSRNNLQEIRDIFSRYPGESFVRFRVDSGQGKQVVIAAHRTFRVFPCKEMLGELEAIIGQKVICRYGEKNPNHRQSDVQPLFSASR